MFIRSIICFIALLTLSGCASKPETQVEYKSILIVPPDEYLVNCILPEPPELGIYLSLSDFDKREFLLIDSIKKHQKEIILCDTRILELNKWVKEKTELYNKSREPSPP